jgi:hypothetical protein
MNKATPSHHFYHLTNQVYVQDLNFDYMYVNTFLLMYVCYRYPTYKLYAALRRHSAIARKHRGGVELHTNRRRPYFLFIINNKTFNVTTVPSWAIERQLEASDGSVVTLNAL